mmetsp:Transcript_46308/g.83689  ORF Transcript_46308/g.83689 Transcript_46308/m.83689 type:complete len:178 (+) Transcript_46308:76-609(+)
MLHRWTSTFAAAFLACATSGAVLETSTESNAATGRLMRSEEPVTSGLGGHEANHDLLELGNTGAEKSKHADAKPQFAPAAKKYTGTRKANGETPTDDELSPDEKQYIDKHRVKRPQENMCKETKCVNDNDCFGSRYPQACNCWMSEDTRLCWTCDCVSRHTGCRPSEDVKTCLGRAR